MCLPCLPCFRRRKRRPYDPTHHYAPSSSFGPSPSYHAPNPPSYASYPSQTPQHQPPYRPESTTPNLHHHPTPPTAAHPKSLLLTTAPASPPLSLPTPRTTSSPPTLPIFPLRPTPRCRTCNTTPQTRSQVRPSNQNANANRPFYTCQTCKSNPTVPSGPNGKGWITWDDSLGVEAGNPPCDCKGGGGEGMGGGAGVVSRQDRAGVNSRAPGKGFWTCATGRCGYVSWRVDGRTRAEAGGWDEGFVPWLV